MEGARHGESGEYNITCKSTVGVYFSFVLLRQLLYLGLDLEGFFTFHYTVHQGISGDGVEGTCLRC